MRGESFSRLGLHVGPDWHVRCDTYDDTTPILDIDAGSSSVAISLRGRAVDQAAVDFAQALADGARKFADEVERMHAADRAGTDGITKAAGSDAA